MRRILFALGFLMASLQWGLGQSSSHFRLAWHAIQFSSPKVGLGAWITAPDIGSQPGMWMALVGPSLNLGPNRHLNLELLGGGMVLEGNLVPTFSVRGFFQQGQEAKWNAYGDVELLWAQGTPQVYFFGQWERKLSPHIWLGAETENTVRAFYALGGHVHFNLGKFHLYPAFQGHLAAGSRELSNQFWLRVLIDIF